MNDPQWLSAIGTIGAFAVALILFAIQIWDRRSEVRDRRVEQARLVSAWLSDILRENEAQPELVVLVRNGSTEPVYGVLVQVGVGVRGTFVRTLNVLGPNEMRELRIVVPGYLKFLPEPDIAFKDAAGRQWVRRGSGEMRQLKRGKQPDFQESPGAYESADTHPTMNVGFTLEAQRGRKVQ